MTTAQTFLEAAYNRSASNDPGKLALDAELVAHLDRVFQRFYALFAKARPDEAWSETTLTLIGNPAFASLAARPIAIVSVHDADGAKVHLVPASESERLWHMPPTMLMVGSTLRTRAKGGDPLAGDVLTVLQLDTPATLAALTTVVDARFPVRHHQLCIDALALYLDAKDDGRSTESHAKLVAEYQAALSTFASEYNLPPDALEWAHAPAGRSPVSAP